MPAGRPTKYDPKYCEEVIEFMKDGKSKAQFCAHLGICVETLRTWEKTHPQFLAAIKIAIAQAQNWWENKAVEYLVTDNKTNFNTAVWAIMMKNRFGYRDHVEVSGSDEKPPIKLAYDLKSRPAGDDD